MENQGKGKRGRSAGSPPKHAPHPNEEAGNRAAERVNPLAVLAGFLYEAPRVIPTRPLPHWDWTRSELHNKSKQSAKCLVGASVEKLGIALAETLPDDVYIVFFNRPISR